MSSSIIDYYTTSFSEHERHLDGFGQIQRQRTLDILTQFLPDKPLAIADIGGATGTYAFELAKAGHHVHLIDIVPFHIEKARAISIDKGISLAGFVVADARSLNFDDNSFDAVIVHGPLYHLTDLNERIKVLAEVRRILKPNGIVFAFAINRFAGVFYGIHSGQILDDAYFDMVDAETRTGVRDRVPTWYFHLPNELEAELVQAGLTIESTKGVVSPIWMLSDLASKLANEAERVRIFEIAELLENTPIIGQDFVCIGRK